MKFVPVILLFAFLQNANGQTKVPEFGQFMAAEKAITLCEFDPEAEAVIIFDKAESIHNEDNNLITKRRIRMKILKEKGIRHANQSLYYYSNESFEYLFDIRAVVVNVLPNGGEERKELASSAIFDSKVNDKWSEKKFALPGVRAGSIIEYEYGRFSKNYNGLRDWYFQTELPTMLSIYDLVIPPNHEFAYKISKSPLLPIIVRNDKSNGSTYFEMSNIAGLRDEPFMDAKNDYLQKVEFQLSGYAGTFGGRTRYMTTWDELSRELMSNPSFGGQLNRNVGADELLNEAKSMAGPYERMELIYQYIQKNIFNKGFRTLYIEDGVKEAWKNKIGNSAEVNLLLINLLKEAGLEVYPLLVSERDHGKVREGYPFLDQFNNVMAWVVIGDKKYVLDASGVYTPPFLIPPDVVNTKACIVDRKKGGIVDLEEKKKKDKNKIILTAAISPDGLINGNAMVRSYDYARLERKHAFLKSKDRLLSDYFTDAHPGIKTDSFVVNNIDNDSLALEQKFHYQIPINASGEYRLLNLNMFSGMQSNPFISDIRFTDVNYGCLQDYEMLELITLPEGWEPEGLPRDTRLITPDTSISCARYITFTNNNLNVLFRIEFNRAVFDSGDYSMLKEFFKKMTNMLNEQVILKQKN
jgi:hypothetical protein